MKLTPQPNDTRHTESARPLEETKRALLSETQGVETMDPERKASIRSHVLNSSSMSSPLKASDAKAPEVVSMHSQVSAPKHPEPERISFMNPKSWMFAFGGFATVAVAIALVFFAPASWFSSRPSTTISAFGRITVPEVLADNAFVLTPLAQDALGVDTGSAWKLTSKVAVTTEMLKQTLTVTPAVEVAINENRDGSFVIQPKRALKPNEVYQVSVATDIAKTDGSSSPHVYTWALQTKSVFGVLSTIPGSKTSGVPTNTGIEFTFTHENVKDISPFFSISPEVKGKFETHGRSVVFVPEKPLAQGIRYTVTLKKGVGVEKSSLVLGEDMKIEFETAMLMPHEKPVARFEITTGEFEQGAPGKPLFVSGYIGGESSDDLAISIDGFALTHDQVKQLIQERSLIPDWMTVAKGIYAPYERLTQGAMPAFHVNTTTTKMHTYSDSSTAVLPAIDRTGAYAIRFTPVEHGTSTWMVLQVTRNSAYITADKQSLYAWVVDQTTSRPLSHLPVNLHGQSVMTDDGGVAKFSAEELVRMASSTRPSDATFLLEIGSGADWSIVPGSTYAFGDSSNQWYGYGLDTTVAHYLMTDRPIYRPTDELNVFGFVQERQGTLGKSTVRIEISKGGGWYDVYGRGQTYDEQTIETDVTGAFQAKFTWKELLPGYYSVQAYRNGKQIGARSIEIRDFVKPVYTLSLTPAVEGVYAGQSAKATIEAEYYDGTPFAKSTFQVTTTQDSESVIESARSRAQKKFEVTTDASGRATFDIRTEPLRCDSVALLRNGEYYPSSRCDSASRVDIQAVPSQGEDAQIMANASISIFATDLAFDFRSSATGTRADIDIQTYKTHLDAPMRYDEKPEIYPNRTLKGRIRDMFYEKKETGTQYDFITKTTYPTYTYNAVVTYGPLFTLATDASGKARYSFEMKREHEYQLIVEGTDDLGRMSRGYAYQLSPGWWNDGVYTPPRYSWWDDSFVWPSLEIQNDYSTSSQYSAVFDEGQIVRARFMRGNRALEVDKTPGVLTLVGSNGIRVARAGLSNEISFPYSAELIPSAEITAVTFINGDFISASQSVMYDANMRALDLDVRLDKNEYRPGETVTMQITATRAVQKTPAKDARILVSSIDKSLEAVSYLPTESPLGELYGWVPSGIIYTLQTRSIDSAQAPSSMAEKGGGGGDGPGSVRKSFKDTAMFTVATTDEQGHATISFPVPDNLTTWRTTVLGVTRDVYAGSLIKEIRVTKPVFVDVVVPNRLLTADKPTIMLRAHGIDLKEGDPVEFKVWIPTLGVNGQSVSGKAYTPVYLGIPKLLPGLHKITMQVKHAKGEDALEQTIDVADTRYTSLEQVDVDAVPGAKLPDLRASEEDILFTSKARGSVWHDVVHLWYSGWTRRFDALVARRVASELLTTYYKEPADRYAPDTASFSTYLQLDGYNGLDEYNKIVPGARLFPYASPDTLLASNAVATMPEAFPRDSMEKMFTNVMKVSSTREQQIAALAGLAVYHDPVLLQLREMRAQKDLSWHEQLLLARGFALIGDQSSAREMLDELLKKAKTRNGVTSLEVSDRLADRLEASAEAAAIAINVHHEKAEPLMEFVRTNWSNEAFPVLAKARYLKELVPTLPNQDVRIAYTFTRAGKEEKGEMSFKAWPVAHLRLTRDEAKSFVVTESNGPVVITMSRAVNKRPEPKPEIAIERTYVAEKPLDRLSDGDQVTVKLSASWLPTAQQGCYLMKDYLPGNAQALTGWGWGHYGNYFGFQPKRGEMVFTVCMGSERKVASIEYRFRVTSRGSYVAEAPLMQHSDYPSIATMGKDQVFTVK